MNALSKVWCIYFRPKRFELAKEGRVYECLGIRFFKRYLPTSGDIVSRSRKIRRLDPAKYGLKDSLHKLERQTRNYEARHIFGALSMLLLSWWAIEHHGKGNWAVLLIANLMINGYPIMLQRYNRVRVQRAMAMQERLANRSQGSVGREDKGDSSFDAT